MKPKTKNIEAQLRDAILNSEISRYRLCKMSGVTNSQLSYFVHGKRSLTLGSAAKVAQALGLELAVKKRKKKAR
jgi:transcriptional regulator with XRE-family HTH domain